MRAKLPVQQEIAARAYELYLERGRQDGHDVDDWLQAEYELLQLPIHKLAELDPAPRPMGAGKKKSLVEFVQSAMML